MELVRIHNTPATPVRSYSEIVAAAADLQVFLEGRNGNFAGEHKSCYGLHHCQVSDAPLSFFVIAKKWVKGDPSVPKDMPTSALWPAAVIINPKILEAPEKIIREVPTINAIGVKEILKRNLSNVMRVEEACMSFPNRSAKKKERFYRIRVEYQIRGWFGLRTKREWLEGLRAHIFQHEVDHDRGINMFWGDRVKNHG
jgi:hypothetical protein